jgi:calcineurin-like phosphoesterase
VERVLSNALSFVPTPFDVAEGDNRLNAVIVDCDAATGRAEKIERIVVRET